jgi:hypothetical protein
MEPVLALVPRQEDREATRDESRPEGEVIASRSRGGTLRSRILKDARTASRGYILAFSVPAAGE